MYTQELEKLLKALANGKRLEILRCLKRRRTATAGKLAKEIGLSMEATSHHLSRLTILGILRSKKRGKFVTYRLNLKQQEPVRGILRIL